MKRNINIESDNKNISELPSINRIRDISTGAFIQNKDIPTTAVSSVPSASVRKVEAAESSSFSSPNMIIRGQQPPHKISPAGHEEAVARQCNCKMSKCLKLYVTLTLLYFSVSIFIILYFNNYSLYHWKLLLYRYCECFAALRYCHESCRCLVCHNREDKEEVRLLLFSFNILN